MSIFIGGLNLFHRRDAEFAKQSVQGSTHPRFANDEQRTANDFFPSLLLPAAHSLPASPPAISSGLPSAPDPASPDTPRRGEFRRAASLHASALHRAALYCGPPGAALLPRQTPHLQSRRSRAGHRTPCNRSGRSGTSSPAPTGRVHCAEAEVRRPPAARHRKSFRSPETSAPENSYAATDPRPLLRGAARLSRAPTAACLAGSGPEHRCATQPLLLRGVPAS